MLRKLYENGMDKIGRGYCFMGYQETITFILEMIGTIAFAASGALVGSEQKMDIFGVSVLGVDVYKRQIQVALLGKRLVLMISTSIFELGSCNVKDSFSCTLRD